MRWLIVTAASALAACSINTADDQALLEQQRQEAKTDAVFASVEQHAACAGFHRAHVTQATSSESEVAYHKTAATNAAITAREIAGAEVSKDLASEMVDQLAEAQESEWAYALESGSNPESILSQASTCEALGQKQKSVVRDLVKAKYGFKKP